MAGSVTKELLLLFRADGKNALQEMQLLKMSIADFTAPLNTLTDHLQTMGMEFETNMANVNTLINVSKGELQGYSDELVNMSLRVPQSAAKLSDALYQALSAGIPKEQALDFTEAASKAATAGLTNTYTMVDAGTSVMKSFGKSASDATEIFDLMFQTVKDGKVTAEQLGQGMGMIAPAFSAAGVSMEQMFAAISTVSGELKPEQTFTGLAAAVSELNTTNSKAEKAIKGLGYANLETALKTNTFQQVIGKLNNAGIKTNDIFGQEAARAVNVLGNSQEIASKQLENSMNSAGAASAAFAIIDETLAVKMEKRKNAQDALALQIAKTLEPAEKMWLDVQTKLLGVLVQAPDSTKRMAGVMLGLVSVTGKATTGAIGLASGIKSLIDMKTMFGDKIKSVTDAMGKYVGATSAAEGGNKLFGKSFTGVALGAGAVIAAMMIAADVYDQWIARKEKLEKENDARSKKDVAYVTNEIADLKKLQKAAIEYQNGGRFGPAAGERLRKYQALALAYENRYGKALSDNMSEMDSVREEINKMIVQKETLLKQQTEITTATQAQADADKAATTSKLDQLNQIAEKLKGLGIEFEVDPAGDLDKQLKQANKLLDDYNVKVKERAMTAQEAMRKANLDWAKMQAGDDLEKLRQLDAQELEYQKNAALQDAQSGAEELAIEEKYKTDLLILNADYDQQLADQTEKAAEDAKKAEEQRLADLKEAYDEQTKLMANRVQLAETVFGSFTESLGGSMDDAGEAWRAGAKKILIGIADFLEQKLMAGGVASILEAIFNPLSTVKNAGLLLAGAAGLEVFKAGVASFDVGGIPQVAGMGMLHPGDVIVNPTSDNAMMRMLVDKLSNATGGNQRITIELDGRIVAENTVKHVNQINRGLPRNRTVWDQGR